MRFIVIVLVLLAHAWAAPLTQEQRKELFQGATQRLKATEIEKRAPAIGDTFPDLMLGEKKISQWTKQAPLVLTFYRGGWCPFCMKQLKEISNDLAKFKTAQVVAVSPETEKQMALTKKKNQLKITLIQDKENQLARLLGIAFKLEDEVAAEYRALGIDLAQNQGNGDHVLPVPATFVIGQDMKVMYRFVDADYSKRAALPDVVKAVDRLMAP